jgi:hypothetical protein
VTPAALRRAIDRDIDMETEPLRQVDEMDAATFFDLGLRLLGAHGPHLTDDPILMQMRRVGLGPGRPFARLDQRARRSFATRLPSTPCRRRHRASPRASTAGR